ncbi:MAG: hypothetical protein Nk1A_8080 [Endomicrobiia bacterium]|nr:MAG: hypothetical protein Nk1A_8080 [Endomicrobiia bacterium]
MSYEDLLMDETKRDKNGNRLYKNAKDRLAELDVYVNPGEITPYDYVEIDGLKYQVQGYNEGRTFTAFGPGPLVPTGGTVGLSYVRNLKGKVKKLGSQGSNLKDANYFIKLTEESAGAIEGGITNFDIWDLDSSKLAHNLKEVLLWLTPDGSLDIKGEYNKEERLEFYKEEVTTPPEVMEELHAIFTEVKEKSIAKYKKDFFNGTFKNDIKYVNDVIQGDLDNIAFNKIFPIPYRLRVDLNVKTTLIDSVKYSPFQFMMGVTQATNLGLKPGDTVGEILTRKEEFFYTRFMSNNKTPAKRYDAYLVNHNGNHLHILQNNNHIDDLLYGMKATEVDINTETEGGVTYRIINGKRAYTVSENTKWYQVPLDNSQVYEYVVVNSPKELTGVINSGIYDSIQENPSIIMPGKTEKSKEYI